MDLLISDIQGPNNQSKFNEGEELEQLLKTGSFTKEMMMMGHTMRDLGSTIKEAREGEFPQEEGEFQEEQSVEEMEQQYLQGEEQVQQQQEEEEDVIDIDNPDELAAKGLKRIQIEGEEEEFLMDTEGNIYDLRGNFIGTTDGDQMGAAQMMEGDGDLMADDLMGNDGEY